MNDADIIVNLKMVTPTDPWWWVKIGGGILMIAVLLGWLLFYFYRRKKLPFQEQSRSVEATALERLAAMRHLLQDGLAREFVREVSAILRDYLGSRFGLRAPTLSTEEFLDEAGRSTQLDAEHRVNLADFLGCCDRVKFAIGNLDLLQMEALYQSAEKFIRQTPSPQESAR